jgi:hypothetical protein
MNKEYDTLREEIDQQALNELRVVRAGAALLYANKVKQSGNKVVRSTRAAENDFSKAKKNDDIEKKMNLMLEGLENLSVAIEETRSMLGDMTAISVVSVLLAERSKKQIYNLMRGRKR